MASDKKSEPPKTSQKAAAGGPPGAGLCPAAGCKGSGKRFGFCAEHFEQFKFGLIRKNGERAADYEKKLEHFNSFKEHGRVKRAA